MQAPKKVEDFAGQRILAMDPRAEKKLRACAACGSSDAQPLGVKNELEIVSCRKCSSVYTPYSPWYSSELYYESYYPEASLSPPAFIQTRLEEITAEFAPYRQTNRLLDIGCGAGNLLLAARKNGWTGHGLDVSENSVKHVRSLGFEVFQGELQNAQFPAQHFDVITAAEILEHLSEPRVLLAEVARLLRPGGLFITDNVLWSGRVLEGEDDGSPATRGVKEFTQRLFAHRGFLPVIDPTRDGVAVALRR